MDVMQCGKTKYGSRDFVSAGFPSASYGDLFALILSKTKQFIFPMSESHVKHCFRFLVAN